MTELLKNNKFRFLLIALFFVTVFEVFSVLNIRFSNYIELPVFAAISILIGHKTIVSGIKNQILKA
jgi:hypothetical protein